MAYADILKKTQEKTTKYICQGVAIGSIALAFCYGSLYFSLKQPRVQGFLQEKINKCLPFNIHFSALHFKWRGINPGFLMENVSVYADGSNVPNLVIEEVFGYVNLTTFLFFKKHIIEELTLVGTDIVLETQDYLQYQIKSIPQLSFSLENKYSKQWMERFRFIDSDVIIEHPKYTYNFIQTDVLISPNTPLPVVGHATYIDSDNKPCFINFKHFKNPKNNQPQWMLSYFGSLEHVDNLFVSHDWMMNKNFITEGNAYAVVWITQNKTDIDLYAHMNIQSFNAHYHHINVAANVFEATIVGKKTKDEVWLALKDFNTQEGRLNAVDISVLSDTQLLLKKKIKGDGTLWELNTTYLPVVVLNEIKTIIPFVQSQATQYSEIEACNGRLEYLSAEIYSDPVRTTLESFKADFKEVSFNLPGELQIQNLTGQVNYDDTHGKINLNSHSLSFFREQWFLEPFVFDTAQGTLFVDVSDDQLTLSGHQVNLSIDHTVLNNSFQLSFPKTIEKNKKSVPELDLVMHLENLPVPEVKKYLPAKKLNSELYHWLVHALDKGTLSQGTLVCRGALNEFPFNESQGVFQAYAQLKDVDLHFSTDWPLLTEANVDLIFDHRALYAKAFDSKIQNVPLKEVSVTIPDLADKSAFLLVDLKSNSTLQKASDIIKNSPLSEKVGKPLESFGLSGNMDLQLNLHIPLKKYSADDIKVEGLVQTSDAQFNFSKRDISVAQVNGQVQFTQDSILTEKLEGMLWGQRAEFNMKACLKNNGATQINVKGKADVHHFIPLEQSMLRHTIQGIAGYTANFNLTNFGGEPEGEFAVYSDLAGIELAFPEPFYKGKNEKKPLKITGAISPAPLSQYQLETPDYHMVLGFDSSNEKTLKFVGGHLHLGNQPLAKFQKSGSFLINGQLAFLDAKKLVDWYQYNKQPSTNITDIDPTIDLQVDSLDLYGLPMQDVQIEGKYDPALKNILIAAKSNTLSGIVSIPKDASDRAITVDVDTLIISDNTQQALYAHTTSSPQGDFKGLIFSNPLEIKIKNLIYRDKKINYISAQFESMFYGYYIKNFGLHLGDAQIEASGYWYTASNKSRVDLTGKIKTKDISSMTEALALKSSINKAKGEADFSLSWDGYPFYIAPSSLSGEMNFKLKDGIIQGVNPGFGRILSLLNIDNFRRRLSLDFSDLKKEGISFDRLSGTMHLLDGVLHSDKIIMDSASVRVATTFMSNLETQVLHGQLDVMPNLTGSLPIAAAIAAGNPAVGAAVWVMDKLFGRQIQEINRYEYRLMGTWNNPQIEDMNVTKHVRRDVGRK